MSGCPDNTQCDFNSDGFIDVFDICLIVDCISSNCYLDTYNYFDNSHNLKHSFLWLDYYAIPVANGLPLNAVSYTHLRAHET